MQFQEFDWLSGHCICAISTTTQVIIEILLIPLVKDCVISSYIHLTQGNYTGSTNFQNGRLAIR